MALKLEITTIYSHLIPVGQHASLPELWEYLDTALSYDIQNAFFIKASSSKAYIRNMWDGKSHLFSVKTGRFLTGLLPYVQAAIQQYGIPCTVVDQRPTYTKTKVGTLVGIEPRKYQREALDTLLVHKRGILWASPRAGKTLVELMLHHELGLTPHLSICRSIDIANQTKAKFEQYLQGVGVGLIADGKCDLQDVTIATVQSIAAAYDQKYDLSKNEIVEVPLKVERKQAVRELVESAKIVWYDEAHHATSSTSKSILSSKIYSAEYIFGCSGTPYREDNTGLLLEGLLGTIIYEIGYSKLIEEGFLIQPTIHLIKIPKTLVEGKYYSSIYKECIVDNELRNDIIKKVAEDLNSRGKSCMILVSKLRHGEILQKLIKNSLFSYSKTADREQVWEDLRQGKLMTLITTLGDEGVDLPSLSATIIAAGGESAIKVFQRLRCLTPFTRGSQSKEHAIIVDFLDPYKYLKTHSNKRKRLYRSEPAFKVVLRKV